MNHPRGTYRKSVSHPAQLPLFPSTSPWAATTPAPAATATAGHLADPLITLAVLKMPAKTLILVSVHAATITLCFLRSSPWIPLPEGTDGSSHIDGRSPRWESQQRAWQILTWIRSSRGACMLWRYQECRCSPPWLHSWACLPY